MLSPDRDHSFICIINGFQCSSSDVRAEKNWVQQKAQLSNQNIVLESQVYLLIIALKCPTLILYVPTKEHGKHIIPSNKICFTLNTAKSVPLCKFIIWNACLWGWMYLKLGKQKLGRVCRNTARLRVLEGRKRDKVEGSEITRQNNTLLN